MRLYLYLTVILLSTLVTFAAKPRVIVSTDIGGSDPDDYQSLVHYLVYADLIDTEGLISSPPGSGRLTHIHQTLDAYKLDHPKLNTYSAYPSYDQLKSVSVQGATGVGAPGSGKSTNGSRLIVNAARKSDSRPLYVLVWGSITDVAQALYDAPDIKSKIRVYSIGSWNTAQDPASRDYVYNKHADLWFIESDFTFRGMYEGGTQSGDLGNSSFVAQHVKGHGALGNFFNSKKTDIKMGDTPSFLYMISPIVGGVGSHDNPTSESWGGKYKSTSHGSKYWTDISDNRASDAGSVNKWRTQYLRHWQGRMDRCLTANGGTPPPPPPPPTSGLLSNVKASSNKSYQLGKLAVNAKLFIDRTFVFSNVGAYNGLDYILTANDDKSNTASSFLTFTLNTAATVSVAYDVRATAIPSWLSTWTNTGSTLTTSDVNRKIYSKGFAAGTVTLGGNMAPGATGAVSMYSVIVKPSASPKQGISSTLNHTDGLITPNPGVISILDMQGRVISTERVVDLNAALTAGFLPVNKPSKGSYMLQYLQSGKIQSQRRFEIR